MIKKANLSINLSDEKRQASHRFNLILSKLQQEFAYRKLSSSFGRLTFFKKKDVFKLNIISSIQKRIIQQTFLTLKLYHKFTPQKNILIEKLRKLFFVILIRIFHQKQRKNYQCTFQKIKNHHAAQHSQKIKSSALLISSFGSHFQKRVLLVEGFKKIKKISLNQIKLQNFFVRLNRLFQAFKLREYQDSFDLILKQSFRKKYFDNVKRKHDGMIAAKNQNLSKQEQNRLLKAQISALTKTLQFQQASKTKNRKEDFDRNLVLQAKSTQKQKNAQQLKKISFQFDSLNHQLNKKQAYVKLRQDQKKECQNTEGILIKVYDLLTSEKTKQSMSLKEISLLLNKQGIDVNQALKKFALSKQNFLNENIDLKNIQNLYEKDLPGYGFNVNIKESETYRKTMEENINLRQFLQILLIKNLSPEQKQMLTNKQELSHLIEGYQASQKGSSKITLTTLSSSTNGFSR